ncbi:transmembrane protein adipocyte-associated 1 homolog [Gigantopelta aegis]|uniref:transmembrane protein adipocyte-associated 1 homolog n=1 Tax=Gigantopelta aegis TaxID=1735272 RepID=UPI001B88B75F|nr:transmembrane protein adipocyte-associated 1 homolog [Gigantopelta aegis]XP_041350023.1 transmembrane protein adipocyte-associated 1 homolog [Gigantopelta aegis]
MAKGSNIFSQDGSSASVNGSSAKHLVPVQVHPNNGSTPFSNIVQPPCQWILNEDLGTSRVRIWDLIILIPNVLFMMFLLWRIRTAVAKLRNSSSPIFLAFYGLVFIIAVISVLRCIVSMTVNASMEAGDIADKALWLVLRYFLLFTELSVVTFGLAFGHLDSHTSIRRVLIVTSTIALAYSCTQGTLEFKFPDSNFHMRRDNTTDDFDIFAHGGMIFWLSSSLFFFLVYSVIVILPLSCLKTKLALPSKKSFYYYCSFLAILNLAQAIGSALLYANVRNGMCVVDVTSYLYFTCFDPLIYGTFLREFFSTSVPSIPFSYKHQVDELTDEDTVNMPCQPPFDKEETAAFSSSFDSTHFNRQNSLTSSPVGSLNNGNLTLNSDYYQDSA